ncbi:PUA-like domain protein [Raphanus sativus]|nr:PUA-like domain protein [Raphanus sativus]KAJ4908411.1 PUA-like domain protein [Raphanus sativus]
MTLGDLCFFYHSGTKSRCVVGVVEVAREWYEDDDDEGEGEGAVDVKAVGEMRRFVDLKEMKGDKGIKDFVLFRQPRLSVVPVEVDVWQKICELGDGFSGDGDGISFSNTEETLTQAFSQYGRLLGVNVVMDKIRCRPKEFAYVKFSSKEEADEALLQLNGQAGGGHAKSGGGGGDPSKPQPVKFLSLSLSSYIFSFSIHLHTLLSGKRTRYRLDGSKIMKVYLEAKERNNTEYKLETMMGVYRKLTGKDVTFEYPVEA